MTYPKCGTTWTQEIVWNIVNGVQVTSGLSEFRLITSSFVQIARTGEEFLFSRFIAKYLDVEIIKPILARSPFVDSPMIFPAVTAEEFYTKMDEGPSGPCRTLVV